MKSLVKDIRDFFNKRSRATDSAKEALLERKTLAIENGESASRLLKNQDFALMFNLYRFSVLSTLEDVKEDKERIELSYFIAGVRDFVGFIEKTEHLGLVLNEKLKVKEKEKV